MKENVLIRFLYNTWFGRKVLKTFINPAVSAKIGKFLNSSYSNFLVPLYIKIHKIDMSEYENVKYGSFNDFFVRKKKPIKAVSGFGDLISPCDGHLSIYKIDGNNRYNIKGIDYSISELLKNNQLAKEYQNGFCFIFRLAPENYHRYCYIDNGEKSINYHINGVLHCVRDTALAKYPVHIENSREYTVLYTQNFGKVIQIEVGALLVGKIHNHHGNTRFFKGDEKGYFEFGGSTIILLFKENAAVPKSVILSNTQKGIETKIKIEEVIGEKGEGI